MGASAAAAASRLHQRTQATSSTMMVTCCRANTKCAHELTRKESVTLIKSNTLSRRWHSTSFDCQRTEQTRRESTFVYPMLSRTHVGVELKQLQEVGILCRVPTRIALFQAPLLHFEGPTPNYLMSPNLQYVKK